MASNTEIIEKYLLNQLSPEDRGMFEEALKKNPELKKQTEAQQWIMESAKQMGLKSEIKKEFKKAKVSKLVKKVITLTLSVAIAAFGTYYAAKKIFSGSENHIQYELNEKGEKNWSDADKYLESQVFEIDPKHDTIIETKSGIIFQVKAGTFLNKFGEVPMKPVSLEIKEAMTAADIVKAGLSTTSNGQLLETGGMFYINGRSGDENLTIDQSKPIQTHVPYAGEKNMSLFDGERLKDGSINWINPKPVKKQLKTVDILKLNFYPPHFLDTLAGMGFDVKNKKLTDSIYYSFHCGHEHEGWDTDGPVADSVKYGERSAAEKLKREKRQQFMTDSIAEVIVAMMAKGQDLLPDGEKLFRQNCSMCHEAHTNRKLTAPGLKGVFDRAPKGNWLKRFILNNYKLIKSGDPYAVKVYNENGKAAMTSFEGQLSDLEVDAILAYIKEGSGTDLDHTGDGSECEISPSRIHAIWDKKFNGTILATKEFEERLQVIFTTCNANLLSWYVENLDKELWELDSVAILMARDKYEKFREFYKRRDGGVNIKDEQAKQLQRYMHEKKAIYDKAVMDARAKLNEEENKLANEHNQKVIEHSIKEVVRDSKLFSEELEKNLDEAYRQIGKPRVRATVPPLVSGNITSTGWKNLDVYVFESTASRTTLDYTDLESGKKAVIEYKEVTVSVANVKQYDRVLCYLLPEQLSSFQLMKNNGDKFSEKLNMTFQYSMIVVGYKGTKAFYHDVKHVKPENYKVSLKSINQEDLIKKLNSRYTMAAATDVLKDLDFNLSEQKEAIRVNKIREREAIISRLMPIVFPCYQRPVLAMLERDELLPH